MEDRRHFFNRRKEDRGHTGRASTGQESPHRYITRDGAVNILKHGAPHGQPLDLYRFLMTVHWPVMLALMGLFYLAINAVFAALYMLDPSGITGMASTNFSDYFFFSSHIYATLGFSVRYPVSFYCNVLTTMESFCGWCSFGLISGLLFARFSRPSARVIFSHHATIEPYEGVDTLTFRAANRRGNMILQARVHVTLARNEKTLEGENIRRIYDLRIMRHKSSFFNLTWTLRHVIDETSPLYGQTAEEMKANETEVTVLLSGTDDMFGQTVHGHFSYNHEEILLGHRFASMFRRDDQGTPIIDFSKFDRVESA